MLAELIRRNRSCRRFAQTHAVDGALLRRLVDLARLSASAQNLQPLKYILSTDHQTNALIFPCLGWAGYLSDWPGPEEGERPSAYIVILGDTTIADAFDCDLGIAAQSILLGAREAGLGGCMIASVNRKRLGQLLAVGPPHSLLAVIAIGKPVERATIDSVESGGDIRYWRDNDGVHHVPKRRLDDIVVAEF